MAIKKLFALLSLMIISNFSLAFTSLEGQEDKISHYLGKGKWTVVEIWESNCGACRMHMPDMVKFDGKLDNVQLLGVSLDTQEGVKKAKAFIAEYKIEFPTLISNSVEINSWMEQKIRENLLGTPTFIIFNPEGKLAATQPGIVATASLERYIKSRSEVIKDDENTKQEKKK